MSQQKTHHTKQFLLDAINYRNEYPDLTQVECAKNRGIGVSTLARREAQFRDFDGGIPIIDSGNYASEEAKELARLRRELRDTQGTLDVLKKPSAFWEKINRSYQKNKPDHPISVASYKTSLISNSTLSVPMLYGAPTSHIYGLKMALFIETALWT